MSKYYKAEDIINFLNVYCPKDMWEYQIADIPTIEVSEDCISREQTIEAIDGVDWYHVNSVGELVNGATSEGEAWYRAEDIYKAIESVAPSVVPKDHIGEPTDMVGEWHESEIPNELYVCSVCGCACWAYDWDRTIVKSRYCPNCGAKMKG